MIFLNNSVFFKFTDILVLQFAYTLSMTKFVIFPFLISGLAEQLFKAPSVQKMEQIKQNELEKRKTKYLCQKQLEKNKIPESCYQISPLSKSFKNYLDKKCSKTPLESIKIHEISHLLKNRKVSRKCWKILKEKEKILKYQKQDFSQEPFLK